MKNGILIFAIVFLAAFNAQYARAQWTPINMSSNLSVNVFAEEEGEVFVGTTAGVYHTADNAESWMPMNNGLSWGPGVVPSVLSLVAFGNTFLAGTDGKGAYRSIDRGRTWAPANTGLLGTSVNALIVHHGIVFAGTDKGVFRSIDYGVSWRPAGSGLPSSTLAITTMAVSGNMILVGSRMGVFISFDDAASWSSANVGLTDTMVVTLVAGGGKLFAGTPRGGVFISQDSGATWNASNDGLRLEQIRGNLLPIALNGPNVYVATATGIYHSSDAGAHWVAANSDMPAFGGNFSGYKAVGAFNGTLFAGACGDNEFVSTSRSLGVYRSSNNGAHWEAMNAGLSHNFLYLYPQASYDNNVFVGTSSVTIFDARTALYCSKDNGGHWVGRDIDEIDQRALIASNHTLFAGTLTYSFDKSGLMTSVNAGESWQMRTDSAWKIILSDGFDTKAGIHVLARSKGMLYASTLGGVAYRSADNGMTWTNISEGLLGSPTAFAFVDRAVLVATNHGVFVSTDAGSHWSIDTNGMGTQNVTALVAANGSVYAGTSTPGSTGNGVFVLAEGGNAWIPAATGMPANCMVSEFVPSGSVLFAATDHGVYYSLNGGENWFDATPGLIESNVTSLAVTDTYIFAGSANGVYRRPLADLLTGIEAQEENSVPQTAILAQNFPNPFSGATSISFTIPAAGPSSLTVYDECGAEVESVWQGSSAGAHVVTFGSSALKSGSYWCVLRTGGHVVARRMTVVR